MSRAKFEKLRLNIGCGPKLLENYVNIDKNVVQLGVVCGDATDLGSFENRCASEIFTSHVIEHLDKNEIELFFEECYRLLEPGGVIVFVAPSMELAIKKVKSNLYGHQECGGKLISNITWLDCFLFGVHSFDYNFHKQGIFREKLETLCLKHGFRVEEIVDKERSSEIVLRATKLGERRMLILQEVNFYRFYQDLEMLFRKFSKFPADKVIQCVKDLCTANFECYKANMSVLDIRRRNGKDFEAISNFENAARTVGEKRVKCKCEINKLIGGVYRSASALSSSNQKNWRRDDLVYSIGELIDKLIIEFIKEKDLSQHSLSYVRKALESTRRLIERIKNCLEEKLREVEGKDFYEYVEEARTYNERL